MENLKGVIMGWAIFIAIMLILNFIHGTDSTDKSRWKRSGMSLYIDHGTGLHYIKGGLFGTMIPRLDANGEHYRGPK